MTKAPMTIIVAAVAGCLVASGASAGPVLLSDAEMDSVVAGSTAGSSDVMTTDGFVCPVLTTDAVLKNSDKNGSQPIGEGHYTIAGPDGLTVPVHATNGGGDGTPPGPHSEPGDTDYTAIWAQ